MRRAAVGQSLIEGRKDMTRKATQAEIAEAAEGLRTLLKPGDTIHTIIRHVSRSGMSRRISFKILKCERGKLEERHIDWAASVLLNGRVPEYGDPEGVRLDGCGMDMGFHGVYNISRSLFPDGHRCAGKNCPSNDHTNGDRNYDGRHKHSDGGYAIKQRWL